MSFPTTLDTTSTIPVESASTTLSTNHVTNHTASQVAIIALETKVGIDSSADSTTIDYKLKNTSSIDPGHHHTNSSIDSLAEAKLTLTDITTNNVTSTKHGFTPKSPADATKFLNGASTPDFAVVKDSDLSLTDITTNNASSSKHGFLPKLPNDATKFLDGTGAYTVISLQSTKLSTVTINTTALTATQTTIAQFTGLTGDTDDVYEIDFEFYSTQGTNADLLEVTFNNDTTAGHYSYAYISLNSGSTTVSNGVSESASSMRLLSTSTGYTLQETSGKIHIKASKTIASAYRHMTFDIVGVKAFSAQLQTSKGGGTWSDASNQITSIEIRLTQSSGSTATVTGFATIYKINR